MCCTFDELLLVFLAQVNKVGAEAPHANDQVSILLRFALRCSKDFRVDHIRLKLNAAQRMKRSQEALKLS